MKTNEMKIWEKLNSRYKDDKEFRKEVVELIRFYGSKLVQLADSEEKKQLLSEITEECILGQYFHGYYLMNSLIEESQLQEEQVFYPEFWSIPKGMMLNQIGQVMELFGSEWANHDGLTPYNLQFVKLFPEGYDLFREITLETANYGAYKAVLDSANYKGTEKTNTEGLLIGDIYDIHFVNPQVFLQAQFYSSQHEIWDVFKGANGKNEANWIGTIHLSTIPTDIEENNKSYILSVSLSDTIRLDEKSRILEQVCERLPEEIRATMQLRMFHLSDLEVLVYNKNNNS